MSKPGGRAVVATILALFVLSVAVRLPQLNRPLSYHHEFNTAMYLVTLDIWSMSSAADYRFAPVMTYPGEANAGIELPPIEHDVTVRGGDFFYLSFPAMAYVLPHAVFKAASVEPTPLGLQVLGMVVHLLCAMLLALIVLRVVPGGDATTEGVRGGSAIVAACAYLFSPALLWFHGNVYVFDSLVLVFLLATLLSSIVLFEDASRINPPRLLLLGLTVLAGTLTEYVAFILAAAVFVMAGFRAVRDRRYAWVAGVTALAVSVSIVVTVWQYAGVVGLDPYLDFLHQRFVARADIAGAEESLPASLLQVAKWYVAGFLPAFVGIAGLMWLTRRWEGEPLREGEKAVLFLSLAAVIGHHALLFEWTSRHDYSVIKTGIPLALVAAMLFARIRARRTRGRVLRYGLAVFCLLGVAQYTFINPPGPTSIGGQTYADMEGIGDTIARSASPDEVVFMSGLEAMPQIVYRARRNIQFVDGPSEAAEWLRSRGARAGFLVEVDGYRIRSTEHIVAD